MWRQIGGGSLLFSIGMHVALIAAAGIVIMSAQMTDKTPDFVPGGRSKDGEEASKDLCQRVKIKTLTSLARRTPKTRIQIDRDNGTSLPPADSAPLPDASEGFGMSSGRMTAGAGSLSTGPSSFLARAPNFLASRCSTQSRLEKLRKNGGTPECELAVSRSLEWLKTRQNADGSWARANKAAMTGLSLLCFLGRCETPESPFYGDTVRDGMLWLVELGRKNPHAILSENPQANSATYEHGIATYALGEMYSFYRLGGRSLPGLRDAFENGVRVIIENQNERGAWSYGGKTHAYDKDSSGEDLSVAGWQFQALKAAKNSGLKFAGLDKSIERCCDYLESKQTKDGGFGKTNRDEHYNQWSLTGCGVLGLQTLARNKTTAVKKGVRFLRDFLTAEPLDWNRNCNLYCWYYYTQAFFQAGGDDWKFYNAQFLPQVLAAQQPDGSFQRGRPNWPAGDAADAIYRQALCTLQLEVYYRYLKVADREVDSVFE
ncbi:MAG: terpene cyclase/mutase family protein [Verrucomicrobiaceae bacterium]|nr:terpene cyclase/mutase family protein [Verrucomicrobiaceae bacterium]